MEEERWSCADQDCSKAVIASYGGGASEYGDRISLEPARGGRGGGCVLRGGRPLGDLASMLACDA